MELRGKVIAITGGFGALGLAIGAAAINQGAHVALIDRAAGPVPKELPTCLRHCCSGVSIWRISKRLRRRSQPWHPTMVVSMC
jgi:hypothetical protein